MIVRMLRLAGAALGALALSLSVSCAVPSPVIIPPKPDLFPRAPAVPESKTPGRVALLVVPEVRATWTLVPLRFQTGSMVEQALLLVLQDGLQGGVQSISEPPLTGSGFDATLVLHSVQLQFRTEWPGVVSSVWLAFDMKALDATERGAWTRNYYDNMEYSISERLTQVRPGEMMMETELRLAHEAAWRLSQQVLHDLREWLAAERTRPREM